jgi:hypothetical protein
MAYNPSQTPPQTNSAATLPQGFWASAGGAYTYQPQQQSTAAYQLNQLTSDPNNAYLKQARNSAMAGAAARGLGNSSYAAGNAQGAAIRAALPIATNDANMNAEAERTNAQYLNQMELGNRQNQTSITTANIGAGASMYGSDRAYDASRYGQDQQTLRQGQQNTFDAGQADINRQFQQNMLGLQNYYGAQDWSRNLYGNILQGAYGTMYSNPDYFSDPNAAMGFVNGFGNFASNQIDQYMYGGGQP